MRNLLFLNRTRPITTFGSRGAQRDAMIDDRVKQQRYDCNARIISTKLAQSPRWLHDILQQ